MTLKCIGSGSSGNCHALIDDNGKILLLDVGLTKNEILKAIDFKISDIVGAVVTHAHSDHSKSISDLERYGIPIFKPYEDKKPICMDGFGGTIKAIDMTDLQGNWMHTNADGSECPCYGFLIEHYEIGRMLYITDTELIKWRFKNINHILLGVNYDKNLIDTENHGKANHVYKGHLSIDTACDFVKSNNSEDLQNVIMCHLSKDSAEPDSFIEKMQKVAPQANVYVARKGLEVELRRADECPF